ncbi:septum formation family protein [Dactylosporangium sp. NPDC051485]|uniref:septum formation family protein n=1 Tax=Dactylosporangium sp. NPDC051485 TaxID=3154846 RepID=UPI003440235E
MRRALALVAAAVLLLGSLSGCARPSGTDGDLVDDWAMLPAGKVPEPVVGACFDSAGYNAYDVTAFEMPGTPVPCDGPHQVETAAVGQLPPDLAKAPKRPERDQFAPVYPACEQAVAQYLGADWQSGRLYLYLKPPTYAQWLGGLRTYHCDVVAIGPDHSRIVRFDKPFKGAAAPGGPLAAGCFTTSGGDANVLFRTADPAPCTGPHDLEYAGFVTVPATTAYPASSAEQGKLFGDACEAKVLAYMGMTRANYRRQNNVSTISWGPSGETGWKAGDHSARCYLMSHNRTLSRSVKGIGNLTI